MESKKCCNCGVDKPLSDFYSQKKKRNNGIEYVYYRPDCKECTKNNAWEWQKQNVDLYQASRKRHRQTERFKQTEKSREEREHIKEYRKNWRRENKEKIKEYNQNRLHKLHKISDEELEILYQYCDYSCMYCGMHEIEVKKKYGQKLHKDHALNEGSNEIDNCILACKGCNVSKGNRDWQDWYTPDNSNFTYERYIKIEQWLNSFIK